MSNPSPAELQWRINHLAGQAPAPPPERFTALAEVGCTIDELAEGVRRLAQVLAPSSSSLLVASIPSDPDELDRQIRQEAERSAIGSRSRM